MKLFWYTRVKRYLADCDTVSTAALQRKFNIGYALAAKTLDRLGDDGKIKFVGGKWYVVGSDALKLAEEENKEDSTVDFDALNAGLNVTFEKCNILDDAEPLGEFTEENVLKLFESKGKVSTAMLQVGFAVGYAQAADMLLDLANKGYVINNGDGWIKKQ